MMGQSSVHARVDFEMGHPEKRGLRMTHHLLEPEHELGARA
jgi:hypothetical protein